MSIITPALVGRILEGYSLPVRGTHGITHWARVLENARRLAAPSEADLDVVELFAVFHDSRRMNESIDPAHGMRGTRLARELRGSFFELDDQRFKLLEVACAAHTDKRTHADPSVQVCWDSDRLDLLRVGIWPHPHFLSTQAAKDPETLNWANDRASRRFVPALIEDEWGIG